MWLINCAQWVAMKSTGCMDHFTSFSSYISAIAIPSRLDVDILDSYELFTAKLS